MFRAQIVQWCFVTFVFTGVAPCRSHKNILSKTFDDLVIGLLSNWDRSPTLHLLLQKDKCLTWHDGLALHFSILKIRLPNLRRDYWPITGIPQYCTSERCGNIMRMRTIKRFRRDGFIFGQFPSEDECANPWFSLARPFPVHQLYSLTE